MRRTDPTCVFCRIVAGEAPATIVREWPDALAIVPLNPVVPGHLLVLPRVHVTDFVDDPAVSGLTAQRAAELARDMGLSAANEMTSKGAAATQTVWHLHRHLVPRAAGDGLPLPWTPQQEAARAAQGGLR
ncbi:HIT family protein [Streptomyces cacaoi]|uniref:HIT family protein n=1 Tax=Streptomyces cacaoi TaxID=1898 RepID=UPI001CA8D3C1|nr:HIT domain-containing protein [Streptomyces cacaoi]